jgi:hypothetical protein
MIRDGATRMPTTRQRTVLQTLRMGGRMSAREMGLSRSDVCWRMEELGWVLGSMHNSRTRDEKWQIRQAGKDALHRAMVKLGLEED